MINSYSLGRFEIFVVATVIAIVATIALGRYVRLAEGARNLGFELTAHHFMTGAANLRTQWLTHNLPGTMLPAEGGSSLDQSLVFSPQGWPLGTSLPVSAQEPLLLENCYQLWLHFLQNPAPISLEGKAPFGSREFHVLVVGNSCRYQLFDAAGGEYFFDYFPWEGRMRLSFPELKR